MWNKNLIGQTLLQRFRVDAFVAAGGMGVVYKAWDLQRSAYLAMKVLHSDLAGDPAAFRRFEREANHLKNLAHPNIVPFYGLFQTADLAFLLEAFINGPTLKEILLDRQGRPLPLPEVLAYLRPLCASLGYAHSQDVVHCDVKPGNVLVDHAGNVYLTDFGISHQAESANVTLGYVGTPAYMAPEQIRGEVLTPRTDIYALGVMLFEMLTGQRPFLGNEPELDLHAGEAAASPADRVRAAHLQLPPPDPLRLNPRLPAAYTEVIRTALAKDPAQRYVTTGDLFHAVVRAAGPVTVPEHVTPPQLAAKRPVVPWQSDLPVPPASIPAAPEFNSDPNLAQTEPFPVSWPAAPQPQRPVRRSRARWPAGLALLMLLLLAGLAWFRPWASGSRAGGAGSTPSAPGQAAAQLTPSQMALPALIPNTAATPPAMTQAPSTRTAGPAVTNTPNAPAAAGQAAASTSKLPAVTQVALTSTPKPPTPAPARPSPTPVSGAPTGAPAGGSQPALPPGQTPSADRPPAGSDRWTSPKDGMLLVRVPAGPFQMGSDASPWAFERPPHTVTLNEFWIDQTEVTNAMFARFVQAAGYVTQAEKQGWGFVYRNKTETRVDGANWQHPFGPESTLQNRDNYPAVQLAWADAQAYCTWAGRRLPTEAEWEKAARGTDSRLYPWGNQIDCQHANYNGCRNDLTAVDAYPDGVSPYGALDMSGNAWEWVADWYQADYYGTSPAENPTGPASGSRRVHRGGAWYNFDLQVQAPYRFSNDPTWTFSSVGVRCAANP